MADNVKAKDKVENPKAQFDKPKEIVQDKLCLSMKKRKATEHLGAGRATVIDGQQ
jgi:hypothetical protein